MPKKSYLFRWIPSISCSNLRKADQDHFLAEPDIGRAIGWAIGRAIGRAIDRAIGQAIDRVIGQAIDRAIDHRKSSLPSSSDVDFRLRKNAN